MSISCHMIFYVTTVAFVMTPCFRPLRIFEFSLVERLMALDLGLHDGDFGLQPITSSMDEKSK